MGDLGYFLIKKNNLLLRLLISILCSINSIYLFSGYITFSGDVAELDREARLGRPFTFYAVATDSGTPQNSARVKVSIYLNDINDNAPIVTFPNVTTDIALVRISQGVAATKTGIAEGKENIASSPRTLSNAEREWSSIVTVSGSSYANNDLEKPTLTHIEAIDLDEGENAQLSFAIVDGNNRNYFGIDVQSGNITLAPGLDLDSIDTGCHVLKILVKDLGDQPKSSFAYVSNRRKILQYRFDPVIENFVSPLNVYCRRMYFSRNLIRKTKTFRGQ